MQRALVAGATGYLGGFLVGELKRRGYRVRVLVRSPEQAREFPDVNDVFVGEITDADTIRDVASGMDVVYSTVGITRQRDGFTYDDVDYSGNLNLMKEAERALVGRFVYVSILHGEQLRNVRLIAAEVGGTDVYSHNDLGMHAFRAIDEPARMLHFPVRLVRIALSVLRLVAPVTVYGPIEFFFTVMTTEMVAPRRGSHHIDDFFKMLADDISHDHAK